jgi:hypothetical protein
VGDAGRRRIVPLRVSGKIGLSISIFVA